MIRAHFSILAIVVILVLGPTSWAEEGKAETVTLVGTDYVFTPNHLVFRVGSTYRLHFENRGKDLHEFTAPAFLKAIEISNPEALNQERTEIVVEAGQAKDLYFVPRQAGQFTFLCADHDWAGMTGDIVVE
jgi:plastocyanin